MRLCFNIIINYNVPSLLLQVVPSVGGRYGPSPQRDGGRRENPGDQESVGGRVPLPEVS